MSNVGHSDKLTILGLRSLQMRRLHQDLIYTYKITFGLVDLDCSGFFSVSPNEATLGHTSQSCGCSTVLFCNRVVKIRNSLPATVEDYASIRKFKSLTERVDLFRYEIMSCKTGSTIVSEPFVRDFVLSFNLIDFVCTVMPVITNKCQWPWHCTWFFPVLN